MQPASERIFVDAVNAIAASLAQNKNAKLPVLYGPNGSPLPPLKSANYQYHRATAKRSGTMKKWIPKRLISDQQAALERIRIVERSIDLTNNHPHAAGVVDTFATTIVGAGLNPNPVLDPEILGIEKVKARDIQH